MNKLFFLLRSSWYSNLRLKIRRQKKKKKFKAKCNDCSFNPLGKRLLYLPQRKMLRGCKRTSSHRYLPSSSPHQNTIPPTRRKIPNSTSSCFLLWLQWHFHSTKFWLTRLTRQVHRWIKQAVFQSFDANLLQKWNHIHEGLKWRIQ